MDTAHSRSSAHDSLVKDIYNIGGKIMLAAIVVLFMVVVFILGLHIYARYVWQRYVGAAREPGRSSRRRRLSFLENDDPLRVYRVGLEKSVIETLPVFVYRTENHRDEILECAVCLCEFEDNEEGRLLPKCNHSFHIDCIDMWFDSNSTCPLCRTDARPESPLSRVDAESCPVLIGETFGTVGEEPVPASRHDNVSAVSVTTSSITVPIVPSDSQNDGRFDLRSDWNVVEGSSSPKSVGSIVVDIPPRRLDIFSSPRSFMADDQQLVSSGVESPLKSPTSRLQSLRRILGIPQSPDGSAHIEQGGPAKV